MISTYTTQFTFSIILSNYFIEVRIKLHISIMLLRFGKFYESENSVEYEIEKPPNETSKKRMKVFLIYIVILLTVKIRDENPADSIENKLTIPVPSSSIKAGRKVLR